MSNDESEYECRLKRDKRRQWGKPNQLVFLYMCINTLKSTVRV